MCFKIVRLTVIRNGLKRTISVSDRLGLLKEPLLKRTISVSDMFLEVLYSLLIELKTHLITSLCCPRNYECLMHNILKNFI